MRYIVLLAAVMLLAGCVSMDVSTLDTAKPLGEDKARVSVFTGTGASLTSVLDWESTNLDNPDELEFPGAYLTGAAVSYGMTDHSDLGIKAWAGLASYGGKITYKHVFPQSEPGRYTAILPALAFSGSEFTHGANGVNYNTTLWTGGAEAQFLLTKEFSPYLQGTVAGQIGAYLYHEWDEQNDLEVWSNVTRLGAGANLKVGYKPIYLLIEPGAQIMVPNNDRILFLPYLMAGLGWEIR